MSHSRNLGLSAKVPDDSVMIDIETCGTSTNYSPIIQIGAAKFDSDFMVTSTFKESLTIPASRPITRSSEEWWAANGPSVYKNIRDAERPFVKVLSEFATWLPDGASLWAWPVSFDLVFLLQYGRQHLRAIANALRDKNKWIDSSSWISGRRSNSSIEYSELDRVYEDVREDNVLHDGLSDTLWQIRCLKAVDNLVRSRERRDGIFGGLEGGED